MHQFIRQLFLCAVLLLVLPVAAMADSGPPLFYEGAFFLLFLNVAISIVEGTLIAKRYGVPQRTAVAKMLMANYFSAIVGAVLLNSLWKPLVHIMPGSAPVYKALPILWILTAASWVLSVVLEWPFCHSILREKHVPTKSRLIWRSLRASILAQTTSYLMLVPLIWFMNPASLYTNAHLHHDLSFVKGAVGTVFYINPQDGAVWRIQTDGSGKRKVREAQIHDWNTHLFVQSNEKNGLCDIGATSGDKEAILLKRVGTGFASGHNDHKANLMFCFGGPADLRPENQRHLTVFTEFWAEEGMVVENDQVHLYQLALQLPAAMWSCRCATVLPSGQVVFQLGLQPDEAQIMILDPAHRDLGFLTMGQGPVVVMNPRS